MDGESSSGGLGVGWAFPEVSWVGGGNISGPVTVNGDADPDTLVLTAGNLDAITRQVIFNGGGGANSVILDDTVPNGSYSYNITASAVTRSSLFAGLAYSAVSTITLQCGPGASTVRIAAGVSAVVHAYGNNGNDNFIVGGGNLNGFFPQDINGGPGIDQITFDDSANPAGKTWDINETFHPNEIIYSGLITLFTTGFESVGILAGTGTDNITFNNDVRQNYSVNGGTINANIFRWNAADNYFRNPAGADAIYAVDLVLGPRGAGNLLLFEDISRLETDYFITDSVVSAFDLATSLDGADVHYHNADYLTINGSNESNTLQLASAHPDTSYNFFARGGNDRFDLTLDTSVGGQSVRTDGNDGVDSLFITDTGSSAPANYAITSAAVTRTSVGGSRYLSFNTIEAINVSGTPSDDTFSVSGFNTGAGLTVNGGLGNDVCNFGNDNVAAAVTNMASFLFNGMEGTDTFNLRNATPANSFTYTAGANTTLQASRTSPSPYSLSLEYYNTEQKAVYAGPAVDVMNITSFASGELSFHGAGGDDALNLPTSSDLLGRRVNFFGDAGTANRINQVTNSKTAPSKLHVTQNTIGAFLGDDFFAPGGSVYFDSVQTIQLRMGSGADTVYAQPLATGPMSIDGNLPLNGPGVRDKLNLATAGLTSPSINGTVASGNLTSTNRPTLSWTGFEGTISTDAVAPVVVAANINLNGIPGGGAAGGSRRGRLPANQQALDVSFSEDVSGLISPASIELTNLTTGQTIPAANIAVTYNTSTNTAHFTFPGYPNGVLPDGNYHGRVLAGLPDFFGNALVGDSPFDFFFLGGDANHDRVVDVSDLGVLATNWQTSGKLFSEGDFNYDGEVNVSDLGILATNWQRSLPPPSAVLLGKPRKAVSFIKALSQVDLDRAWSAVGVTSSSVN